MFFVNESFDFSSAQNPSCRTSVSETEEHFSTSIIGGNNTTLLVYHGNYINLKDVGVENFLITVFPFGVGGPEMKRCNKVSRKECLKKYLRTSLPHFQQGDAVWIMYHMFSKILSYETGIMIGRSNYDSTPLAKRLAGLTTQDIKSASEENDITLTKNMKLFTNALSTSWRALVHTPEAAKMPRTTRN